MPAGPGGAAAACHTHTPSAAAAPGRWAPTAAPPVRQPRSSPHQETAKKREADFGVGAVGGS